MAERVGYIGDAWSTVGCRSWPAAGWASLCRTDRPAGLPGRSARAGWSETWRPADRHRNRSFPAGPVHGGRCLRGSQTPVGQVWSQACAGVPAEQPAKAAGDPDDPVGPMSPGVAGRAGRRRRTWGRGGCERGRGDAGDRHAASDQDGAEDGAPADAVDAADRTHDEGQPADRSRWGLATGRGACGVRWVYRPGRQP